MAWEQSRAIPWSKISQDAEDPDAYKELVFRELQREVYEAQQQSESLTEEDSNSSGIFYSTADLLKNAAFGGCIGSITGAVFGFMDGMRTAGESKVLQNASNSARGRYLLQGTTRSATIFGLFFGGFHVVKYGLRVVADPGEWTEIGVSGAVSLGAIMSRPALRPSMPYATMLVFMDGVHIVMREFDKK